MWQRVTLEARGHGDKGHSRRGEAWGHGAGEDGHGDTRQGMTYGAGDDRHGDKGQGRRCREMRAVEERRG